MTEVSLEDALRTTIATVFYSWVVLQVLVILYAVWAALKDKSNLHERERK